LDELSFFRENGKRCLCVEWKIFASFAIDFFSQVIIYLLKKELFATTPDEANMIALRHYCSQLKECQKGVAKIASITIMRVPR
jgi:hypothetical protein